MAKIKVKNPIVEIDGDEMTRIIWQWIRERLILHYLEVDLLYFDLGIEKRDETDDYVAAEEAARAEGIGLWQGEFMLPADFRRSSGLRVDRP